MPENDLHFERVLETLDSERNYLVFGMIRVSWVLPSIKLTDFRGGSQFSCILLCLLV